MQSQDLTAIQREAAAAGGTSFLYGPAGTGKTTALHHRLLRLLREGELAYTILTLVAEPEHRAAYSDAVHNSGLGPYAELTVMDYSRLAQSMVARFWPRVAPVAGCRVDWCSSSADSSRWVGRRSGGGPHRSR